MREKLSEASDGSIDSYNFITCDIFQQTGALALYVRKSVESRANYCEILRHCNLPGQEEDFDYDYLSPLRLNEVIPLVGGVRWNSVHKHLFVIHKHIDVITLWQVRYPVPDELRFTREDWDYIEALLELCTPLMEMTKRTEGQFTDGTHGALWETICSSDFILRELDHLQAKFAEEPRYKVLLDRIVTTREKLKIYRNDLDSNIAFIGAVVLNPGLKWRFLENQYTMPVWQRQLRTCKTTFSSFQQSFHAGEAAHTAASRSTIGNEFQEA